MRRPTADELVRPTPTGALTVAEACRHYGLSRSQLGRLRQDEGFPAVSIGRKVLVPVAAAERWFASRLDTERGAS